MIGYGDQVGVCTLCSVSVRRLLYSFLTLAVAHVAAGNQLSCPCIVQRAS